MRELEETAEGVAAALREVAGEIREGGSIQGEAVLKGLRDVAASLDRVGDALFGIESALRELSPAKPASAD